MGAFRGLSRRAGVALAGVPVAIVAFLLGFGPVVRSAVRSAAARRGLEVQLGHVSPAWLGVRLVDIVARPVGVEGVEARVDEIRILVGPALGVERIGVRGATLLARGSRSRLQEALAEWRRPTGATARSSRTAPSLEFENVTIRWLDEEASAPRLEVYGIAGERGQNGLRVTAARATARAGGVELSLANGSAELDEGASLRRARAASVLVEWDRRESPRPGRDPSGDAERRSGGSGALAASPARNAGEERARVDPAIPLLELPDLRAAREITAALSRQVPPGADVGVDAVVLKIIPRESSPLTFGPGQLTIAHGSAGVTAGFSAGAAPGTTALSVRAALPLDGGDVTLEATGGPASLALLGLQNGATGLFDVEHATVTGRARLALAADASALNFDCTWAARGVSLRDARLAAEAIRGLDVQLRASGTLAAGGSLRFDELATTLGALRLEASGVLDQQRDHFAAAFRFNVPTAPCQTLLSSVPTALLPLVETMTFSGTFGAEGRVVFDSRSLDDLELEYDVKDRCRVEGVPSLLSRDALTRPFLHRVYLPDGSIREEETGPGTTSWTPLEHVSPFMEVAVTTTEDGAFRRHHGYSQAAIRASVITNLKARRFVRGASTITMQLAKNLFLSREKTLSRKLEEVILTDYLEQAFSKDEILELYLNVVEFGPSVYGIAAAADYYFGRSPAELNLAESLFLSSLLPAPLRYAAMREAGAVPDGWMRTLRSLMHAARRRGLVSDEELAEGLQEPINFWRRAERPPVRAAVPGRPHPNGPASGAHEEPEPEDVDAPSP